MGFLKRKSKDGSSKRRFSFRKSVKKKDAKDKADQPNTPATSSTPTTPVTKQSLAAAVVTPEHSKPEVPLDVPTDEKDLEREPYDEIPANASHDEDDNAGEISLGGITPVKQLLDDLNMAEEEGMEMVLGVEPGTTAYQELHAPKYLPYDPNPPMTTTAPPKNDHAAAVVTPPSFSPAADDPTAVTADAPEDVTRKLLDVFHCAEDTTTTKTFQELLPEACAQDTATDVLDDRIPAIDRTLSYRNDAFAVEFLEVRWFCVCVLWFCVCVSFLCMPHLCDSPLLVHRKC